MWSSSIERKSALCFQNDSIERSGIFVGRFEVETGDPPSCSKRFDNTPLKGRLRVFFIRLWILKVQAQRLAALRSATERQALFL